MTLSFTVLAPSNWKSVIVWNKKLILSQDICEH